MEDLSNENIVHIKNKNVEYLQFKKLLEFPEISHCYSLSVNNFDVAGNENINEKKQEVIENYKMIAKQLDVDYNNIVRPRQTHTDIVKCITKNEKEISLLPEELADVDGLLTNVENVVLSLGFADCTPIFIYDTVKKVIGDIHSGWRGTLQGIGKNAILKMISEYGSNPKDIICCIGPCIKKCHFEVKKDVRDLFYDKYKYTGRIDEIIENVDKDTYHIDTTLINKIILQQAGVLQENIIDSKICTVCNNKLMHSHRSGSKGRNTAIISLKNK